MELSSLWPFSVLLRTKDQFALFVVASFTAKLLHLFSHRASLPILLFLLYLPTFLLPDVLLIVFGKTLVYRQHRGRTSTPRKWLGGFLAFLTAATSSAQISFYAETGGEVQWMAAGNLAFGHGGLGLITSGAVGFGIALLVLSSIAWVISPRFYDGVERILEKISLSFKQVYRHLSGKPLLSSGYIELNNGSDSDSEEKDFDQRAAPPVLRRAFVIVIGVLAAVITVLILQTVRPRNNPYGHMSGSLPLTLVASLLFNPINSEFCLPVPPQGHVDFPFVQYAKTTDYVPPSDWKPLSDFCRKPHGDGPDATLNSAPSHNTTGRGGYDPACDPLKLSNLDESMLKGLTEGIKKEHPAIKNVMLITMESTRKDMFPFKKDSEAYKSILSTYSSPKAAEELDKKLQKLTENAAFLTGESTRFDGYNRSSSQEGWRAHFKDGMGGINVQGAITQSAFTLKSLLTSHCGVEPLPVDFTEEVKGTMYQPCFPHIAELFNAAEAKSDVVETVGKEDFQSWPWESALVQSITDQWDSQDIMDEQMGFKQEHIILSSTLTNTSSKYYPPKEPPVNYFGYPEPEIMPYLRDMFTSARRDKRRLFISHVTSTTHHPFAVPKSWGKDEHYLNRQRWSTHDPFDNYLNTIRYQDEWVSQIFTMLEQVGALNETLVVLVGDHGLAFKTPDGSQSTFENGHISNFAIPLVFAHPQLPHIQVPAQTTPTSIIPTVLDLLLQTHSLGAASAAKARSLLPRYQGASMIRDDGFHLTSPDGGLDSKRTSLSPWHFSVINPGGSVMAISHAGAPYRLILPLCSTASLRFTDTATDAWERDEVSAWTMGDLQKKISKKHGRKAAEWAALAEELGRWWFWEQRERWNYHMAGRSMDRGAAEGNGGRIKKEHWWET